MGRCSVDSHRVMAPETGSLHQERAPLYGEPGAPLDVGAESGAELCIVREHGLARGLHEKLDPSGTLFFGQTLAEMLREHPGVAAVLTHSSMGSQTSSAMSTTRSGSAWLGFAGRRTSPTETHTTSF